MELIGEILSTIFGVIFGELIKNSLLGWLFYIPYMTGVIILKVLTWNSRPIKMLKHEYKDSSKPWFLGFGAWIGINCFVFEFLI